MHNKDMNSLPMEAVGRRAGIATGHPDASRAAIRVLDAGGSVADAAIAASAVLAVSMPHATSIGGDAFVLVRDARSGAIYGLNASGTSPQSATSERFLDGMHQHGSLAPVVPGLVRGWEALHDRFGAIAWNLLFEEAIDLAEKGCAVTSILARSIRSAERRLRRVESTPDC